MSFLPRLAGFVRILVCLLLPTALAQGALAQSLADMAGQMVMVGFAGKSADDKGVLAVRDDLAAGRIGGVMFLRRNVGDRQSVRAINAELAAAAPKGLPALISLDQEGGRITRLTPAVGFVETPTAASLGRGGDLDVASRDYGAMARSLHDWGFNLNFGPVVDLNLNPDNPIIARYNRAYGADPALVAAFGARFVEAHRLSGVLTALKHFPGHGSSLGDTHEGFVDVTGRWQPVELEPYRALIAAGLVDMVMVSHLYHADFATPGEPELPASLSPVWISDVLRGKLGFRGVVVTDDLEMGAVRSHFGLRDRIVRAVLAGNDILLFSNTAAYRSEIGAQIQRILVESAEADPRVKARIVESYQRIVALKARLADKS